MLRTRLCDVLGIKYPIIQGGMAWVSTARLASAVSEAGGLGIIGAGSMPGAMLKEQILKAQGLTDKPFGANVILAENPLVEEQVEAILETCPPVVAFGAGNPERYIAPLKEKGIKVISVVSISALAKRVARYGVDVIVAEGTEAGGHIGEIGTIALVPQVVRAVDIPVVAAGGIADGAGLAAALCLGADGAQLGTRFICSEECEVHPNYKEKVLKASDSSTVVTGRTINLPVRSLKNPLIKVLEDKERDCLMGEVEALEVEKLAVGALRLAATEGDDSKGSFMAGQSAGMVAEIKPVAQIIEELVAGAEEVLNRTLSYTR